MVVVPVVGGVDEFAFMEVPVSGDGVVVVAVEVGDTTFLHQQHLGEGGHVEVGGILTFNNRQRHVMEMDRRWINNIVLCRDSSTRHLDG